MRPLILLISIFIGSLVSAQKASLKNLLSYSFPSELTASNQHGAIGWVENHEGVRNIFCAIAPDYAPLKLTNYTEDDGQVITDLQFTEDLTSIVFVRGGGPNKNGEFPNPTSDPDGAKRHIHSVEIKSGEIENFGLGHTPQIIGSSILYIKKGKAWSMNTKGENPISLFSVRGSVSSIKASPDGSKIAFVNRRGDHSFIGVYVLGSNSLQFLSTSIDFDSDPVWSPDGKHIAFLRRAYEKPLLFIPKKKSISIFDSCLER